MMSSRRWSRSTALRSGALLLVPILLAAREAPPSRPTNAPMVVPVVTALTPQGVVAGSPAFRLLVTGTEFLPGARVRWNGSDRATTFVSPTRLAADILPGDVAMVGNARITVRNPGDSTASNVAAFVVGNPLPVMGNLAPASVPLLGEPFTLTVNGGRFVAGAVVRWNGAARPTTFVSTTRLQASIPASDLAGQGIAAVQVVNPPPMGGASAPDTVRIALAVPSVTALTPAIRQVGLGAFTMRVTGGNFIRSAMVKWNGFPRTTTWVSPSQVDAAIPATDVDQVGTANVTVMVVAPNVGFRESTAEPFSTASPRPVLSGIPSPLPVLRNQPVTMTFTGSGIMPGIRATVNGAARTTTFVSASQLRVALDSADVANVGPIALRFENPLPTIGAANVSLGVVNPVPVATGSAPQNVFVGSANVTLTVTGSRFVPGSAVQVNGGNRPTTFVSATQLRAFIPGTDLTQVGSLTITVTTPAPGGGTSAALHLMRLARSITIP